MNRFEVVSTQYRPEMLLMTLANTGGVPEVTRVVAVADSAGSLNNTYFEFSTPATNYYVWFNVSSGGTDPALASKTGVEVAISTNDADTVVAAAIQAAVDALVDVSATVATATVDITNNQDGSVTDASDSGSTGFTISTTTQGVNGTLELSFGGFDATVARTGAGDFTITFNTPFVQVPQVAITAAESVVPRIASVSTSALEVISNGLDGDPKDSTLHIMVIGSFASDSI